MVFGGIQPSEVDGLTLGERDAVIKALNKRNKKRS